MAVSTFIIEINELHIYTRESKYVYKKFKPFGYFTITNIKLNYII